MRGRIKCINYEKFFVNLTTRSEDLIDKDGLYKIKDDPFTDHDKKKKLTPSLEGKVVDGKPKAQYIKVG